MITVSGFYFLDSWGVTYNGLLWLRRCRIWRSTTPFANPWCATMTPFPKTCRPPNSWARGESQRNSCGESHFFGTMKNDRNLNSPFQWIGLKWCELTKTYKHYVFAVSMEHRRVKHEILGQFMSQILLKKHACYFGVRHFFPLTNSI